MEISSHWKQKLHLEGKAKSMKWGLFLEVGVAPVGVAPVRQISSGRGPSPLGLARMDSSASLEKSEGKLPEFRTSGHEQQGHLQTGI